MRIPYNGIIDYVRSHYVAFHFWKQKYSHLFNIRKFSDYWRSKIFNILLLGNVSAEHSVFTFEVDVTNMFLKRCSC
jgi:hypothetical protein